MLRLNRSWRNSLGLLNPQLQSEFLSKLTAQEQGLLLYDWSFWAREKQLPPDGHWRVWLLLAGRGFGKTRAGAEWIRWRVQTAQAQHIGLVGNTFDDVRSVMVEGPSGILNISPKENRPTWFPSRRLICWPCGAKAHVFAAESSEQLRGPEFDTVWADEIAKWRYRSAWDNLMLGLRRGNNPQLFFLFLHHCFQKLFPNRSASLTKQAKLCVRLPKGCTPISTIWNMHFLN